MRWQIALVLALGMLGCGGKAVIDAALGTGGTAGAAGAAGAGGSSSTTSSGGGCDPASHTIDIADFNVGCTLPSDCIPVFVGSLCTSCTCPLFSAINVADKAKYEAELEVKNVGTPPQTCFCPASEGICVQGQCATKVP